MAPREAQGFILSALEPGVSGPTAFPPVSLGTSRPSSETRRWSDSLRGVVMIK